MAEKKKSRFTYSKGQQEINRALKMQELQLAQLENDSTKLSGGINDLEKKQKDTDVDIDNLKDELEKLRLAALKIATQRGIDIPINKLHASSSHIDTPEKTKSMEEPYLADQKISKSKIPSWNEIMQDVSKQVPEDVVLEELLSEKEFQFCIEDVKRINKEFSRKTKLSKTDIAFLLIATALQTARWIILQQLMGDLGDTINEDDRISSKEGDKQKKHDSNDWNENHNDKENKESGKGYPTWKDIVFGQYKRTDGGKSSWTCPYDAQQNAPVGFDDGGKGSHRVNTLGHDPILGWIFGTANLMTCTISLSKKFNFATYRVEYPGGCFAERISMATMFYEMIDSMFEDKFRLAAGLFAQGAHLKSDEYTSKGLPVPILEVFSEELAGKLYSEQYDALCMARDAKIVGAQAGFSILINMIIGFVHGLFYNKEKDGNRDHYEVRTRKILLLSNAISSSINLADVGVNAYTGNVGEALKKLDLGGLLVSLWRLFSDVRFITKVKQQFIEEELDKVTAKTLTDLDNMFEN